MNFSCWDQNCSEFNPVIMVPKWSLRDPPVKNYIFPVHRNGRGQTGKLRSQNIFWLALESFVLPLSTTYLKTKRADGFAEERYFIEVRPLTIWQH